MRAIVFTWLLLVCTLSLSAQEADSVVRDASAQASDALQEDDTEYDSETYSEDYDYEEDPAHTLVEPSSMESTRQYASQEMELKKFEEKAWKNIVGETNYDEEKPEEKAQEYDPSFNIPWKSSALRIIAYVIIIAVAVLVLYFIAKNMSASTRVKKNVDAAGPDLAAPVEDIEALDVASLLQKTLAEGNYRLALRIYFLDLLKSLHAGGIIAWKKDKTNRDYLGEIFARDFQYHELRRLTLAYEQVWYGEYNLPRESYQSLFSAFEKIQQQLNATRTP